MSEPGCRVNKRSLGRLQEGGVQPEGTAHSAQEQEAVWCVRLMGPVKEPSLCPKGFRKPSKVSSQGHGAWWVGEEEQIYSLERAPRLRGRGWVTGGLTWKSRGGGHRDGREVSGQ